MRLFHSKIIEKEVEEYESIRRSKTRESILLF